MAEELNGWCVDCESNNLYLQATECWYIKLKATDGSRELQVWPFREGVQATYDKIRDWAYSFPDGAHVVGWNQLGFDLWLMWRMFDLVPRVGKGGKDWFEGKHVQYVDGYILSQYLSPDSPKHSLDYHSNGSEVDDEGKLNYRQNLIDAGALPKDAEKGAEFKFYHDLLVPYCDRDVDATITVVKRLWAKAQDMYGRDNWLHASFRQMQKDYWLYSAQAYSGSPFHKERAIALTEKIQIEMDILKAEVDPALPPRPLKSAEKAFYKMPSKPYSKAGERSAALVKWLEKHSATLDEEGFVEAYGLRQKLVANDILDVKLPMEIDDNVEIKQYFLDAGWVPTFYNFQKGPDGKPVRDERGQTIRTSPKIQEAGQLCPNLLKLDGEVPAKVVKFLSYRNRFGVVNGWLKNWRLEFDGRLSSEISGYTPTFRVKHKTVVNCPKADPKVLLGYEMRDLFVVPDKYYYCGTDAAALENRTIAGYTFKHDNGQFAKLILEGDSHTFNAFAFFPEIEKKFDMHEEGLKDRHDFKPYRNKSKTGAYLLAYGGGIPKLASSLGLTKSAATIAYNNYWAKNPGLGKLKEAAEKYYDGPGKKKYMPAWDGRILCIRSKNKIINALGQSLGAIAMSMAACMMDTKLGELHLDNLGRPHYIYKGKITWRSNLTHDEYSFLTETGIQDDIRQMSVDCIVEAGEYLKLPIALDGEGKIALNGSWKDVH